MAIPFTICKNQRTGIICDAKSRNYYATVDRKEGQAAEVLPKASLWDICI